MAESTKAPQLQWSAQFTVVDTPKSKQLPGDKILLPPSALEQLLSASSNAAAASSRQGLPAYDPYNSATFSAYRQADLQYQDQRQQLPYPLTFRLVNADNGKVIYAGIQEFSAEENEIIVSDFLRESLGIKSEPEKPDVMEEEGESSNIVKQSITVHASQLQKGTFVKLRPLEAGYDPDDWKAVLEEYLRKNYTTLTNCEVLVVQGGRGVGGRKEEFRFLVDGFKPETDGICIVDTDLEVDIEALNEEQAMETLRRVYEAKIAKAAATGEGSSRGGEIDIHKLAVGQVRPGEYVDYELMSWARTQTLEIELTGENDDDDVDLIVSPLSERQRAKPRFDEHVFASFDGRKSKRIRLEPSNVEVENAESLYIAVHAYPEDRSLNNDTTSNVPARHFTLRVYHPDIDAKIADASYNADEAPHSPADVRCKNCGQWVPQQTLMLHENFCLRNNISCLKGCGQVFQKRSSEFEAHWHCAHDASFGNTSASKQKHDAVFHPAKVLRCSDCSTQETFSSVPALAHHRTSICPAKLILCRFCHLIVPQEGDPDVPNGEAILTGMTPHELLDGARTTECHMCSKIVRLRDMDTHLKTHNLDRLERPAPHPCRNINCAKTQDGCSKTGDTRAGTRMGQGSGNDLGLCSVCFGPLYVTMHDPDGRAMRRRIERRYLSQLVSGCGKAWCQNEFCKTGRKNLDVQPASLVMKDAIPVVKPMLDSLAKGEPNSPLHFCVDDSMQKRKGIAEMMAAESDYTGNGGYSIEWCLGALEATGGDLDEARKWLKNWAPTRKEAATRG